MVERRKGFQVKKKLAAEIEKARKKIWRKELETLGERGERKRSERGNRREDYRAKKILIAAVER